MDVLNILLLFGVGLVAGVINTLAGGGSLLTLPALIFLNLPPNVANATNRIGVFFNGLMSWRGYHSKGVKAEKYERRKRERRYGIQYYIVYILHIKYLFTIAQ